jgi:hypothetical protein
VSRDFICSGLLSGLLDAGKLRGSSPNEQFRGAMIPEVSAGRPALSQRFPTWLLHPA